MSYVFCPPAALGNRFYKAVCNLNPDYIWKNDPDAIKDSAVFQNMAKLKETAVKYDNFSGMINTGLSAVDEILGGFVPGCLYTVAARPGMGKTAFLCRIAMSALNSRKDVYYITPDLSAEFIKKITAECTSVDHHVFSSKLDDYEYWCKYIDSLPFHIYDERVFSPSYIRKFLSQISEGIVLFDYSRNDAEQYLNILHEFVATAKMPAVITSTLPRSLEVRDDKRPALSDLRSFPFKSIENLSDGIIFIYRDYYYNFRDSYYSDAKKRSEAEISIVKNTPGKVGTAIVNYYCFFEYHGIFSG